MEAFRAAMWRASFVAGLGQLTNSGNTNGAFPGTVTGPTTVAARVRVTWLQNAVVQDVGDANFRIQC